MELQLRLLRAVLRSELRHGDEATIGSVIARTEMILDSLEPQVGEDADLARLMAAIRDEMLGRVPP